MKILLIGFGSVGKRHYENLRILRPTAHLILADPMAYFPEGILAYRDWHQALDDHADAAGVIIASPTRAHLEQLAEIMVLRGLPVYCEKPLVAPEHAPMLSPLNFRDCCTVGFQYRMHPAMPRVEALMAKHGADVPVSFTGQDDLLGRYGLDVDGAMFAHPCDTAQRIFGPAVCSSLESNGVHITGYMLHPRGRVSRFDYRMDRGPRQSWVRAGRKAVELTPDNAMYQNYLAAWLRWVEGGPRDPRLATLEDGLAVMKVLAQVQRERLAV